MPDLPDRPAPPQTPLHRAREWLQWVGPARIAASALAVLAVLAGGYWLVRPPTPTTEASIPYATHTGSTATSRTGPTSVPTATASSIDSTATTASVASVLLVVHVAGAVAHSGVYRLAPGSRVIDAVQAAGGLADDADPDAVNLAALVADGQRVYVPRLGGTVPVDPGGGGPVPTTSPRGPVNLNTATIDQLDTLPGVGPSTAAAIVAYRQQNGPFTSVDEVAKVHGIGPAKLEALRGLVTV